MYLMVNLLKIINLLNQDCIAGFENVMYLKARAEVLLEMYLN